jgi:hypothetical protein
MKVLRSLAIFAMATGMSASLFAQATSGNIYGSVSDEQGGKLPGVAATLSGCGAPRTTTTDAQGDFRFLNLAPCTYSVKTELSGFATVERNNVVVNLGTNTELAVSMKIASVATTITVTSETPLLDTRKQSSGTTFNNQELKSIPTARDPWVMLQQTPAVLVDRQNVGGSESGQQDNYVGKGTDPSQNAWNVDGVSVTDMGATGSSSTYYDFDAFQEMQMTTGGTDPSIGAPGVTINMVTKRGTNEVHGSARIFDTPNQLEAKPTTVFNGRPSNSVDHIDDYGVEAGGPLWPDKAWLWGSYGKQQINKLISNTKDKTTLENFAGKFNLQPIESNNFTLFFFRGDKQKQGRNASPTRPQPTTWDQTGPTTIWKGDDSQVFGPNLVANANWSWLDGGFQLAPEGGIGASGPNVFQDTDEVWHNSFIFYGTKRPQHEVNAALSAFFNTGSLGHELKFGFGYRKYNVGSLSQWPGQGNVGYFNYYGSGNQIAKLTRPKNINTEAQYIGGFIGDTITASNLTVNLGLRYDNGKDKNLPSNIGANVAFPELLGAVSYPGSSGWDINTKNWSPRVGLTYALGAQHSTLLRASYARYADQGGAATTQFNNPIGYQYLYYYWTDTNQNNRPDPGELGDFYGSYGVNPADPNNPVSFNKIARNLKAPTTDEFMVGVDHQILPEFVAGLTYTYRHRKDFTWVPYTQISSANYSLFSPGVTGFDQNGNPVGTTGPIYYCSFDGSVGCGRDANFNFGKTLENRPGYSTNYQAVELALTKRLSNRWMAHGSFTWTNWKQNIDSKSKSCQDPTNSLGANGDSCDENIVYFGGAGNSGSYGNVYINAKWAFNVSALYQLPWNFNLGANFYGRQGYPAPYYVTVNPIAPNGKSDGLGSRRVIVGSPDDQRNASLFQLDLRVEKVVPLFQKADLTLSVDLFNALNRQTVLQQRINATPNASGKGQAGQVYEVQSPRILRFGARLSF